MTQRSREEFEMEVDQIIKGNMTTDVQKGNMMLNVIADILLDIRELVAHPLVKEIDSSKLKEMLDVPGTIGKQDTA